MSKKQTMTKIVRKGEVPSKGGKKQFKAEEQQEMKNSQKDKSLTTPEKSASEASQTKPSESEDKKQKKKQPAKKVKKDEVVVNASGLRISTKYAVAICNFIRRKKVEKAIEDLENVLAKKTHVPMRGEYAHRRGKGKVASGAGKYPQYATEQFIVLLKSLQANANNHDVEEPVVAEAIANFGARPLAKFGRWKRKRTNVKLVACEAKAMKKKKKVKKIKKKVRRKK